MVAGDVSSGGVGFELTDAPSLGEPICVSMVLPETGETVSMSAVVCHVEPGHPGIYHVGARFTDLDMLVLSPLERHVEETALAARLAGQRTA